MMPRRLLGTFGRCLLFLLVSGLVIGGLGWVTYASLGVEAAQRVAAADADRAGKERLALWRLDGKLLPTLGVENFRRYEEYSALYSTSDLPNTAIGNYTANNAVTLNNSLSAVRQVSPLVTAKIEPWMLLHVQLDPEVGWQSPQVIPTVLTDQLRGEPNWLDLANVTDERRAFLVELNRTLPPKETIQKLSVLDKSNTNDSAAPVTVTITSLLGSEWWKKLNDVTGLKMYEQLSEDFYSFLRVAPKGVQVAGLEPRLKHSVPTEPLTPMSRAGGSILPPTAMPPTGSEGVPKPNDVYAAKGGQNGPPNFGPQAVNPPGKPGYETDQEKRQNAMNAAIQSGVLRGAPQQVPPTMPPAPDTSLGGMPPRAASGVGVPTPAPAPGGPGVAGPPVTTPAAPGGFGGGGFGGGAAPSRGVMGGGGGGPGGLGGRPGGPPEKKVEEKNAEGAKKGETPSPKDGKAPTGGGDRKETLPPPPAPAMRAAQPASLGKSRDEAKNEPQKAEPNAAKLSAVEDKPLRREQAGRKDGERLKASDASVAKKDNLATRRAPPVGVHIRTMRPIWLTDIDGNPRLLFARAVTLTSKTIFQAVVIDWPALRELLTAEVTDLFPAATLSPIPDEEAAIRERAMAAIPVELDPGPAPELPPAGWTTLRIGLALAWIASLVALGAVWLGGWSLVDLSERRIRFVSAVTHELRTPLTSLRLYLDMLTTGMVKEETKKQEYLNTLTTESDRLNRLIENVLDFSRLERRSAKVVREPVRVTELLARVDETWAERVAADGKELVIMDTVPPGQQVTVDPRMAEQVLGNLIDNARKYTRDAADPRIWLWAKPAGRHKVAFEVEDRGPGVPTAERRSIFRPFRRGAEADTTAGGAGLGLALARQWTDLLGGSLSYRPAAGGVGACFRLELPT